MSFEYERLALDSTDLVKSISYLEDESRRFSVTNSWSIDRARNIFFRTIKTEKGTGRRIHAMNRQGIELLFASFFITGESSLDGTLEETLAVNYDIPEEFESIIDEIKADFIDAYKASIKKGMYSRSQRYDDFTLTITQFEKSSINLWTV